MTLTVCIGASGSGKTTFLNDVHKSHKCTYIRQYHKIRPYIKVCKIPNFDPTTLPYWDIYIKEGKGDTIKVGGTMAGEFTPGLSGGQRKLLLFEIIYQRTTNQSELLIVLDEPFCGVTDDFVPFIVERLNLMRQKHNILLVTNDHVHTLKGMADNTITVSAMDRTKVRINDREEAVDRNKAILALSLGDRYEYEASNADLRFFYDVEVAHSGALWGVVVFITFLYALFVATFWNSSNGSGAPILIAGELISYFGINPYLLSLVDWHSSMVQEAEAHMHASKGMSKALKTTLALLLIVIVAAAEYACVNAVIGTLRGPNIFVGITFDSLSTTFPLICLGLYTNLSFEAVQIYGNLPYLLMLFTSTSFSPGSGIEGLKALRYLWPRFYLWCMVPGVQDNMEGCPKNQSTSTLFLVLTAMLGGVVFLIFRLVVWFRKSSRHSTDGYKRAELMDDQFRELQVELYGVKALRRFEHIASSRSFHNMPEQGAETR